MRILGTARIAAGLALALVAAVGCTGSDDGDEAGRTNPPASSRAASKSPAATPSPSPSPANPVSIPGLIARKHTGSDLRLGAVRARTDAYTSYTVTYEANGLTISGLMNIPRGKGPFPALVLAH